MSRFLLTLLTLAASLTPAAAQYKAEIFGGWGLPGRVSFQKNTGFNGVHIRGVHTLLHTGIEIHDNRAVFGTRFTYLHTGRSGYSSQLDAPHFDVHAYDLSATIGYKVLVLSAFELVTGTGFGLTHYNNRGEGFTRLVPATQGGYESYTVYRTTLFEDRRHHFNIAPYIRLRGIISPKVSLYGEIQYIQHTAPRFQWGSYFNETPNTDQADKNTLWARASAEGRRRSDNEFITPRFRDTRYHYTIGVAYTLGIWDSPRARRQSRTLQMPEAPAER